MRLLYILIFCFFSTALGAQEQQLAYQYFRNGSYEKAASLFKSLYEKNPFNTAYFNYLIDCHHLLEQFDEAQILIHNQLKKYPTQQYLNVELGYLFDLQHNKEQAIPYYEKALKSIETSPNAAYQIGRAFQDNHLLEYALQAFKKGMDLHPTANYNFHIARIYGELGQVNDMMNTYLDMIEKNESFLSSGKNSIGRFITEDPENEYNISLKKLLIKRLQNNPSNSWNELLSWLYIQQGDYDKAYIQEAALFRRQVGGLKRILDLGKIASDNKNYSAAITCFEFVLKNSAIQNEILLSKLLLLEIEIEQSTNFESINQNFKELFVTYGINLTTIGVQIAYADFLAFKTNDTRAAIRILKQALKLTGMDIQLAPAKIKLADIYVYMGNYNSALIYYTQVQKKLQNQPLGQLARFKIAQTSYFKGDFEWAQSQLKVLKESTSQLIANDALDLNLLITDNGLSDSLKVALRKYAKADLLAYQNKTQEAIDSLDVLLSSHKGHPIEDETLYKQAVLFEKQKQYEKAEKNYLKIIAINTEDILSDDAHFNLANLYSNHLNNPLKAQEYFEKIIFKYPSSIHLVAARKKYRELRGDLVN